MRYILRLRLLKNVSFADLEFSPHRKRSDSARSREDSGKSWLHKNDHLYPGRACLTRSPGKTKCFAKSMRRAMHMPRSTVMTWTGSMLISNTVRQGATFGGPT